MTREAVKKTGRIVTYVFWLAVTVLPILGIVFSMTDSFAFYRTQQQFRAFAADYGKWGPVVFIVLQALQVVITPISHYSVGYMGGFLYGPILGGLYNYVGRLIGHVSAFFISRKLGSPLIRKFVPQKTVDKYNSLVSDKALVLFLIYFLPLFPDDEISYLVGLSRMRFRWFLIANLFGHVGGSLSLAYLGSGLNTKDPLFWVLTVSTLLGFPVLWILLRRQPKKTATSAQSEAEANGSDV